jgi:glycosyltransferase involved in cell wall biosynthesis
MVFDNGSCKIVTDFLVERNRAGEINYLFLSERNIGKINAFRLIFKAAPGKIIAYSDDDILFYPNWLGAQLEILENFPKAGMVSGVPVRNASKHAMTSLDKLATAGSSGISTSFERHIPDDWEFDWAVSTGRDPKAHLQATQDHQDLILQATNAVKGNICKAIGSANHFQFISEKQTILQALPAGWSDKMMGSMVELDEAVDQLGYLRLSTPQRYTRHMGNVLSEEILQDAKKMGLIKEANRTKSTFSHSPQNSRDRKRHWLLRIPGGRRFLITIYNRLFKILFR